MAKPKPTISPFDYVHAYAESTIGTHPISKIAQISSTPEIYECKLELGEMKESGLGMSEREAERTAFLRLYELIIHTNGASFSPAPVSSGPSLNASASLSPSASSEIPISNEHSSKPWSEAPKSYLNVESMKFNMTVVYEDETQGSKHLSRAILDAEKGLVGLGEGRSKKDASHNAALSLCTKLEDYLIKYGPPFKTVPEYFHFISKDLPDRDRFPWYGYPKNEAIRIASAVGTVAPIYEAIQAPLDPNTFICTVVVDKEKNVMGYGRAGTAKEASRLAAVDLCARFGHLATKSKSGSPSVPNTPIPAAEPSTPVKPAMEVAPLTPVGNVTEKISSVDINTEPQFLHVPAHQTSVQMSTEEILANLKPAKETAKANTKAALQSKLDEAMQAIKKSPAKPTVPIPKYTLNEKFVEVTRKFLSDYLKDLPRYLSSFKRAGFHDILCSSMRFDPPGGPCSWQLVFSVTGPRKEKILGKSNVGIGKKKDAAIDAFEDFLDDFERVTGLSVDGTKARPQRVPSAPHPAVRREERPSEEPPSHIEERRPSRSEERRPSRSEEIRAAEPPVREVEVVKSVVSSGPCVPIDKPYVQINYPQLTIKSLTKWFDSPKNFGRMLALSDSLATDPLPHPNNSGISEISLAMLERKSQDLLADHLAFLKSPRGLENLEYRASLPIFTYRQEILDLITDNQVVLLSAENGYGKSTQVPNYVFEQMTNNSVGAQCNIIVVTGSILAAKTLANCLAEERGEVLGLRVTYEEESFSPVQRFGSITFCTGEVFLAKLQESRELYGFSHVILDNIEDGALVNDFLMLALSGLLDLRPELRLVMLSSLVEVSPYGQYFAQRSFNALVMAPFSMVIKQHFLEDYHHSLNGSLLGSKDTEGFVSEELGFSNDASRGAELTAQSTEHMPYSLIEAILAKICLSTNENEAILIFLPSGEEISTLHRFLVEDDLLKVGYADEQHFRFVFIHSHIRNLDDVYKVDYRSAFPVRKIYLCTAEAESTFPTTNIVHVIDSCKYRPRLIEACGDESLGTYKWISQVECVRRSRCAGRMTGVGSYYSLMSVNRFPHLPPEPVPAAYRYALPFVTLKAKHLIPRISVEDSLTRIFHGLDPLTCKPAINSTIDHLKAMKAVVPIEELTVLGHLLSTLPIPPHLAKMILYGLVFRCLDPILIIAAAGMTGSPFYSARPDSSISKPLNPYSKFNESCSSDQVCVSQAFNQWWTLKTKSDSEATSFCTEKSLSYPVLVKMAQTKQNLMAVLLDSGVVSAIGRIFNRFIEGPESKEALMTFLNENSTRTKLVQALTVVGLYPNLAVSNADNWRSLKQVHNELLTAHPMTCAGYGIDQLTKDLLCFGFNSITPAVTSKYASEMTRASPLVLALLFTPDIRMRPSATKAYDPPYRSLHVDHQIFFGYQSEEAGRVTSYLKASLEICLKWIFTRLAHPTTTGQHNIKEYTEEEIVRYVDNVIRTSVSLLESEKY